MKPVFTEVIIALIMGMVVPGVLLGAMVAIREQPLAQEAPLQTEQTQQTVPESAPITVRFRDTGGTVTELDMDGYLVGVVCAEMPASFEPEALKAQAVVARTYALKAKTTGGKHGDGSICGDYACCQAYISNGDYIEKGRTEVDLEKIRTAVYGTSGYVLTYDGELIEATYFSCSGGTTEDAAAVWGSDYPYLKATASPGEEGAAYYTDTVYITKEQLTRTLDISLGTDPKKWFGLTTYTPGMGVNTMIIGGKEFKGTDLRMALGLRSTAFSVTADSGGVNFTTRGYGHRVGMSQYGADAMAASGSGFAEILAHYYSGTVLTVWQEN